MVRGRPSDPFKRIQARDRGKLEYFINSLEAARNHNLGRNLRVLGVLVAVQTMRASGSAKGSASCVAARVQNFKSKKRMIMNGMVLGNYQAAHFLPGQLLIAGTLVWRHAASRRARAELEYMFGEVEHLPVHFNNADSMAEEKGLCASFAKACDALSGSEASLSAAWRDWHDGSIQAFVDAIDRKSQNEAVPKLEYDADGNFTEESFSARCSATSSIWTNEECISVLHSYLADQQHAGWQWVTGPAASAVAAMRTLFA